MGAIHRGTYCRRVDVNKVLWVSPRSIVFCSLREFNVHDYKGRVVPGDWDRLEKRFEDLDIYVALKQVCVEGRDWSDTVFYQRSLRRLHEGEVLWGCKDEHDLDQRCKSVEALFDSIACSGYKCQRDLALLGHSVDPLKREDEVAVSVGRHGDLMFCNGAHRLAIAKLLGIERIPVRIAVRHPQWMRSVAEPRPCAENESAESRRSVDHPDLEEQPVVQGH
jgi:hypothetical protein